MVMVRGAFSNAIAPGFRKVVFETFRERPMEGTALVNDNTSRRAYEEDWNMAGFGTLIQKPEGASVFYEDALQGNIVRYTWDTYGRGFRITQEMMEDDLYGVMGGKMSRALGRSSRNNGEVIMHLPYNNAFNSAFDGFDTGVALCGTHNLLRGGTISNTASADFDLTPLQAALEHFHALNDESGLPVMFIPRMLVYSIGDYWRVAEVLKSQYLPFTTQGAQDAVTAGSLAINQLAQEGLRPHLSHYLSDPDAWFVLADNHDVNYFNRRSPVFSNTDDFDSGDAKFKLTRRHGSGFGEWRGVYGSNGAG